MKLNEIYHGFKLLSIKNVVDCDSVMYELVHIKSGASLVYLENKDTNKCFSIGFRTLPEDSTGICHIIEHSVLCGSVKYPVKEPFVNLLKGSMATFLNAMTASDFTIYPVASQNDKDFDNLMSVYLDAVFAPLSVKDPKAFLQEGWHYELTKKEDTPIYKGIVYNEMQGAMSSVEEQIVEYTNEELYKGSCYGFNSGGDPEVIPTLTFDYYKEFYHKHYHPSNSVIYLYGDMDLKEKLKYMDEEYLCLFKDENNPIVIDVPEKLINDEVVKEYEITDEEELENNTYISVAFALDHIKNSQDIIAFGLLNEALMGSNASPLKKALLDKNLGDDIDSMINDGTILPSLQFYLHKTNLDKRDEFINVVLTELKKITEEGIDRELLLATINYNEFKNKEMDSGRMPKGLMFAFSIMQSYNYNLPYETYLDFSSHYKFFKESLNTRYFEELIEKYILNSDHHVSVALVPSKELGKAKQQAMKEKMESVKNCMSEAEVEECIKITNDLIAYQNSKDSIEDVEKLPKLHLKDISSKLFFLETNEDYKDGFKFIEHEFNTNKIAYFRAYFDLNVLNIDEIAYAQILSSLFVKMDTENYTARELQNHIKTYLGSMNFSVNFSSKDKEEYKAKMVIRTSALEENIKYIPEVINEIINKTVFDLDKVKLILTQYKNRIKNSIVENGRDAGSLLLRSLLSKEGVLVSRIAGIEMYDFLTNVLDNFSEEFILKLKSVAKKIFNKNNMLVSLSGDRETINLLKEKTLELVLEDSEVNYSLNVAIKNSINDALIIPSGVSNNIKGINLKDLGEEMNGKLTVVSHFLNFDHLWSEVRVKGGAYGCSLSVGKSNDLIFSSFSDPNVSNTFEVYNQASEYLENFNPTLEEFESYIIGAVAKVTTPGSNVVKINQADSHYINETTPEESERLIEEILNTTIEDVKGYSKLFKKVSQLAKEYSVGNEEAITKYPRLEKVSKLK